MVRTTLPAPVLWAPRCPSCGATLPPSLGDEQGPFVRVSGIHLPCRACAGSVRLDGMRWERL